MYRSYEQKRTPTRQQQCVLSLDTHPSFIVSDALTDALILISTIWNVIVYVSYSINLDWIVPFFEVSIRLCNVSYSMGYQIRCSRKPMRLSEIKIKIYMVNESNEVNVSCQEERKDMP
eukprot:394967_1